MSTILSFTIVLTHEESIKCIQSALENNPIATIELRLADPSPEDDNDGLYTNFIYGSIHDYELMLDILYYSPQMNFKTRLVVIQTSFSDDLSFYFGNIVVLEKEIYQFLKNTIPGFGVLIYNVNSIVSWEKIVDLFDKKKLTNEFFRPYGYIIG